MRKTENTQVTYGEKFHNYVVNNISPLELAKLFRQYNFFIANYFLQKEHPYIEEFVFDARHHLNQIAEILDPYFTKEERKEANNG